MGQHDSPTNDSGSRVILPQRIGSGRITELSSAEKMLIWRRRQKWSQSQMAKILGIHRNTYGRAEREGGEIEVLPELRMPIFANEECLLLRRRLNKTQEECADSMGITRYWFNMMENGYVSCSSLEAFWDGR